MVSSAFTSPQEECNEELITMEEFINKMRCFNEWEEGADYPKDPNNYVYKIDVHNIFKRVHLIRAYEYIEDKFDDYSSARWNDTTTPSHEAIVTRMKELLDRCMNDHALKRIVYIAIIQSGQNDDDDESDSDSDSSDGE